ncbi:hypothetical protein [Methanomassiliicoccus luminyensis]|uniref:hypothetical protein n=1 Tax=Methanomassiliicoccus luminyensis TaxID=1080712 RepID=UPI0011C817E2|nr:hypothetical protein [Methanomassiliicoccus luminyensis]
MKRRTIVELPEPWRRGRRCATCQDSNLTDLECLAYHRSGVVTVPVGGFDERDPAMVGPLDCWRRREVPLIRVRDAAPPKEVDADGTD